MELGSIGFFRPVAYWFCVAKEKKRASGQREVTEGRKRREAEEERLLRVRDENDIAGDWKSGAVRGQGERGGQPERNLSLWGWEWLM